MMSQEQFAQMMQTMQELARAMTTQSQTTAANLPAGSGERSGSTKRCVSAKSFNRLTKFGKGEENWKEYNFEFGVILGSESPEMLHTLKVIETAA